MHDQIKETFSRENRENLEEEEEEENLHRFRRQEARPSTQASEVNTLGTMMQSTQLGNEIPAGSLSMNSSGQSLPNDQGTTIPFTQPQAIPSTQRQGKPLSSEYNKHYVYQQTISLRFATQKIIHEQFEDLFSIRLTMIVILSKWQFRETQALA